VIVVFEIAGLGLLGVVVWVLFRAARERPEETGMRWAAWIGLGGWLAFSAMLLGDDLLSGDPVKLATNALIAALILAVVMGYRRILGRLRERAARK